MSQSDYLKYKKTATVLKQQSDLSKVLNSQELSEYKMFSLENTIINTIPTKNALVTPGSIRIFNMNKKVTNCPSFQVCTSTNNRVNKKKNAFNLPTPHPIRPLYTKKTSLGSGNIEYTQYCQKCNYNVLQTKSYLSKKPVSSCACHM
jgi:hypothetical protein